MVRSTNQPGIVIGFLNQDVEGLLRRLVTEILDRLIAPPSEGGTPVDTGWARSNWIPGVGSPPRKPFATKMSVSTSKQEAGRERVARFKLGEGSLFLANLVPYIVLLNQGSSRQAPAGFVQAAVAQAVRRRGNVVIS